MSLSTCNRNYKDSSPICPMPGLITHTLVALHCQICPHWETSCGHHILETDLTKAIIVDGSSDNVHIRECAMKMRNTTTLSDEEHDKDDMGQIHYMIMTSTNK